LAILKEKNDWNGYVTNVREKKTFPSVCKNKVKVAGDNTSVFSDSVFKTLFRMPGFHTLILFMQSLFTSSINLLNFNFGSKLLFENT